MTSALVICSPHVFWPYLFMSYAPTKILNPRNKNNKYRSLQILILILILIRSRLRTGAAIMKAKANETDGTSYTKKPWRENLWCRYLLADPKRRHDLRSLQYRTWCILLTVQPTCIWINHILKMLANRNDLDMRKNSLIVCTLSCLLKAEIYILDTHCVLLLLPPVFRVTKLFTKSWHEECSIFNVLVVCYTT